MRYALIKRLSVLLQRSWPRVILWTSVEPDPVD